MSETVSVSLQQTRCRRVMSSTGFTALPGGQQGCGAITESGEAVFCFQLILLDRFLVLNRYLQVRLRKS